MVTSGGVKTKSDSSVEQILNILGEVRGEDTSGVISRFTSSPKFDLAIPSPQAMAILGKLKARFGFNIRREDIDKTKTGNSQCSVRLLAALVDRKTNK